MAELKTQKNDASVRDFIESVNHETRKADAYTLLKMMEQATGDKPSMWGGSIIGFGHYHYKYESGRENDWFEVGFSPRKASLSIYLMTGHARYKELLAKLGKHKVGKGCLYINKLADVDMKVLQELINTAVQDLRSR